MQRILRGIECAAVKRVLGSASLHASGHPAYHTTKDVCVLVARPRPWATSSGTLAKKTVQKTPEGRSAGEFARWKQRTQCWEENGQGNRTRSECEIWRAVLVSPGKHLATHR